MSDSPSLPLFGSSIFNKNLERYVFGLLVMIIFCVTGCEGGEVSSQGQLKFQPQVGAVQGGTPPRMNMMNALGDMRVEGDLAMGGQEEVIDAMTPPVAPTCGVLETGSLMTFETVLPQLSSTCEQCHGPGAPSQFSFAFATADIPTLSPDQRAEAATMCERFIDVNDPSQSTILQKMTDEHSSLGLDETSTLYIETLGWIEQLIACP
jgi:hypothetical protein